MTDYGYPACMLKLDLVAYDLDSSWIMHESICEVVVAEKGMVGWRI